MSAWSVGRWGLILDHVIPKNKRPMGLCPLLENQLDHFPKFQKLHIYSISMAGIEIKLIFPLCEQQFPRYVTIFKIAIFGQETWQVSNLVPEVAHILSFYPKGSKLSLFLLYGQWFPRYGPIF